MDNGIARGQTLPGPVAACGHGVLMGLCVGVVVACFRKAHDWCFAKLLAWFNTAPEHWVIIPFWGLTLVLIAADRKSVV